jgi:hypothetical protein
MKDKIHYKTDRELLRTITNNLKETLHEKMEAVKRIAEYAEFLAYHRRTDPIFANSTFFFYNADNITNTTTDCGREANLENEILEVRVRTLRPLLMSLF